MFDNTDKRTSLPRLSLCPATIEPDVSLTKRRVAYVMIGTAVVVLLGIGHLSLRFAVSDMRLQHSRLQADQRELLQAVNRLEMLNESLCAPNLLKLRAVEQFGMMEQSSDAVEFVPMPRELDAKYLGPESAPARADDGDFAAAEPTAFEHVAGVLTNVDRAMAGVER
jgi:hypothetical protein